MDKTHKTDWQNKC